MSNHDPLETAFETLKARSLGRANHNPELEEQLMTIQQQMSRRRWPRITSIVAMVVLCIVATGIAEATTGVLSSLIRSVQVDMGNGFQPTDDYDYTVNPDGSIDVSVDVPAGESGEVTVKVDATSPN